MTRKVQLRCNAQHPGLPRVRCEEPLGHAGLHFHSFYARKWSDEYESVPWYIRARHDTLYARAIGGRAD